MVETALLATGLLLSALAGLLLKPKAPQNSAVRNPTTPTYAERGSFIPYVLGTQRVGALVGWIGKPKTKKTTTGGFLGFGSTTTKSVSQQGWHILCVGPATKLSRIFENGKIIFPYNGESPLTPGTHPSGSTINLKSKRGKFKIYWGEATQPVDSVLSAATTGVGAASRWPHICHIVWNTKALSVANQWPQLDYEIEVQPWESHSLITSNPAWITGVTDPLQGSPFLKNSGADPAHAMIQIMCGPYPHGVGIDPNDIALCEFDALSTILQAEGQAANIYVPDGTDALTPVTALCSDTGAIMSQAANRIVVVPVRNVDITTIPTLDNSVIAPPLGQKEFLFGAQPVNSITYLYKDREIAYRDNDVTIVDDSASNGAVNSQQVRLDTVIDLDIANLVVDRRQQEDLAAVRTFTVTASRGARLLQPGQTFLCDLGRLRVSAVQRSTTNAQVVMDCVLDQYSPPATGIIDPGGTPSDPGTPADDIPSDIFAWMEVPPPLSGNQLAIAVLREREDTAVDAAEIDLSLDSVNYLPAATIGSTFVKGSLVAAMSFDFAANATVGPVITIANADDIDIFSDLTGQDSIWRNGFQYCIINNEICFFKTLTSLGSNQYRVDGLLRGRVGSLQKAHSAAAPVWLCLAADYVAITSSLLVPGTTLYVKSLASIEPDVIDPALVTAVSGAFLGYSKSPYPPNNFMAYDLGQRPNTWPAGGAVRFQWSNRVRNAAGQVSGTQGAGQAMTAPAMDGVLIISIRDTGGVEKLSITVTNNVTHVLNNSDLVTAFGSEPSEFDAVYYEYDGAYASETNTQRITRR